MKTLAKMAVQLISFALYISSKQLLCAETVPNENCISELARLVVALIPRDARCCKAARSASAPYPCRKLPQQRAA